MVKNLPAVQQTRLQSLGQEDALKKGMATHSSIHAWIIPWTEEPVRTQTVYLKSRDVTLPTKPCTVKVIVFPVVMIGYESWIIKTECQRIDAFELRCWRRLLRVLWTARRSNQSMLKEISPECSFAGLMLKLQYFGHLMQRTDSLEKILMLGKTEGRRRG